MIAAYLGAWLLLAYHRVLEMTWHRLRFRTPHRCLDVPPHDGPWPRVTVQLPVYNERFVVERLIDGCAALAYPRDRLEIQVLDDSDDATTEVIAEAVARHAARGINIVHLRRGNRAGYKAGNLQHGLATASGEFVAIFDADCVPDPEFLTTAIRYFRDPAVGIVYLHHTRPRNRDHSIITRAQQPFASSPGDPKYYAGECFYFFFGSPGMIRKTCLASIGGWRGDTLCEDVDFSIRSYLNGWRCVISDEKLASADLVDRMSDIKDQMTRWKTGNAECYRKHLIPVITSPAVTGLNKLSVFAALHVPWLHIPAITVLAFASLALVSQPERVPVVMLWLPSVAIAVWLAAMILRRNAADAMSLLLQIGSYPRVTVGIIKGLIGGRSTFVRSPKLNAAPAERSSAEAMYPVKITPSIAAEAVIATVFGVAAGYGWQSGRYALVLFHAFMAASGAVVFVMSAREAWPVLRGRLAVAIRTEAAGGSDADAS
jgi:hypothetical protein